MAPQVAYCLRALLSESIVNTIDSYDPIARLSGVGVLDLSSGAVRRLAVVGPALIAFGRGVSWLTLRLTGGAKEIMAGLPGMKDFDVLKDRSAMQDPGMAEGSFDLPIGSGLSDPDGWGLLAAEPHSGSTFGLFGCLGVAITVILCLTVAVDRLPVLRRLAAPVIAVGTMSLWRTASAEPGRAPRKVRTPGVTAAQHHNPAGSGAGSRR
ncbi:hypothetical protein [Streptomyces sp. NPDC014995]|uniref:hypothetical protein n=1 Tax=Streptomyces sp. NPDC014995 TaxID=3364936 RepID=UPI0037005ACE